MNSQKTAIRTIYFSIVGNTSLALIKGFAGFFGNSYALIADAIESTTDIISSVLVLLGLKYAYKLPDKKHPYGHGKIEPLITFLVVTFLIISAIIIAYESIENIKTPHKTPKAWTLFVLAGIIIWKEISFQVVIRKSKETNSTSLKADAWHHRSDAITSVSAFIGISIALIFGKGYETADDWAALLASAFILYNSYAIFRPALGEIMDEQSYNNLVAQVITETQKIEEVIGTGSCLVRKAGTIYHIELHIIIDGELSVTHGYQLTTKVQNHLRSIFHNLGHIQILMQPYTETKIVKAM